MKTNPLAELRDYLSTFFTRCRAARWLGALFHVRVCQQIVADVQANEQAAAREAYAAEQEDAEAEKLIQIGDQPSLNKALILIRASRHHDRRISERLTA